MMCNSVIKPVYLLLLTISFFACKSGPFNLIKPASPHQQYQKKLESAGLAQTAMGKTWISNAQKSLQRPLAINLPYQETGYFDAEKIEAIAFNFKATKGQQLRIDLVKKPIDGFKIYIDVWKVNEQQEFKLLTSFDTLSTDLQYEIEQTGNYAVRLQPELLSSGEYTLTIAAGPSLAYPLKMINNNQIKSFWGVDRDGGARRHEGIDIFSAFRTPVLAIAPGTITRVNTNNLGGKVVWLRPEGKNYTLYYAHLDEQTVSEGQMVKIGDTIGRMGSTGNAAGGPPHLHLGIYTNSGAVDPLPFVNPATQLPPKIYAAKAALNSTVRLIKKTALITGPNNQANIRNLSKSTIVRINAAYDRQYRVELPDGTLGYLQENSVFAANKPLAKYGAKTVTPVYDRPDSTAAVKFNLKANETANVLGTFNNFSLIVTEEQTGWVKN